MNPKPLTALNHFTVPTDIWKSFQARDNRGTTRARGSNNDLEGNGPENRNRRPTENEVTGHDMGPRRAKCKSVGGTQLANPPDRLAHASSCSATRRRRSTSRVSRQTSTIVATACLFSSPTA